MRQSPMKPVKDLIKREVLRYLPSILRRMTLEERVTLFRQTTRLEGLLTSMSDDESLRSLTHIARRLRIPSFTATGELGSYDGSVFDECIHGRYALERTWSPDLQRLLINGIFAGREGTYLDIGANIGLTSIPLAKATNVQCIAFEPEPDNFLNLQKNIVANGVDRQFTLHRYALYSEEAVLDFELSKDNHGDNRVRTGAAGGQGNYGENRREVIRVPARRLDDVLSCSRFKVPIAAKVDTQGAEVRVLRGARASLRRFDHLILEFWPYGLARLGDSIGDFIGEVREFPHGAITTLDSTARSTGWELWPIDRAIGNLRDIARDPSSSNYVHVLLSRDSKIEFVGDLVGVSPPGSAVRVKRGADARPTDD